jgi:hypothetical protein
VGYLYDPSTYRTLCDMRAELNERMGMIERDIEKMQRYIGKLASMSWWRP